ncbi:MAG: slipin family protein [Leptospiraceae bacterium]|nr:slipin family protein [Leptospiraceae bacterium]
MSWWKEFNVFPGTRGFLYRNHQRIAELQPGRYRHFDPLNRLGLYALPTNDRQIPVVNQEVLTRDNIALRFSFLLSYRISDGAKLLDSFDLTYGYAVQNTVDEHLKNITQLAIRDRITGVDSQELNSKREDVLNGITETLQPQFQEIGAEFRRALIRDVTFPKMIQELFAKELEARIRARSELENARTQVAAARALKNASEMMKDDDNIRFLQFIETMQKIAARGNHTFVIGDALQLPRTDVKK